MDELYNGYKKAEVLNKNIKKDLGQDVVEIYKRSYNILNSEINKNKLSIFFLFIFIIYKYYV